MKDSGMTIFGMPLYTDETFKENEFYIINQEHLMGRKAGSKNKSLVEKVEDIIADVAELKADSPEQAEEIAEAIEELKDIVEPKESVEKPKLLVGKHPVTNEPVYI